MIENKYLVIEWEDIKACISGNERRELETLIDTVMFHRQKNGKSLESKYLVVNRDEPYADEVMKVVANGEHARLSRFAEEIRLLCDGPASATSAEFHFADKHYRVRTAYTGNYPSEEEKETHRARVGNTVDQHEVVLHRSTVWGGGRIITRLFAGRKGTILSQTQAEIMLGRFVDKDTGNQSAIRPKLRTVTEIVGDGTCNVDDDADDE